METTVSSLVSVFPETKTQIESFSEQLVKSVLDGYTDPLKVKVQLSAMKKVIESVEKNAEFNESVLKEAEKYGKQELQNIHNSSVQIKETGVKYDYSVVGCSQYDGMCEQIEKLSKQKKDLEKMFQSMPNNFVFTDSETGEMQELSKPTRTSTTSVVITINK